MTTDLSQPGSPELTGGVLDERLSSPGLLLALLGQDAMRRLRDAHTAHNLKPRQFQLLGLLHDHGAIGQRELGHTLTATGEQHLASAAGAQREAEDALFAGLDDEQRQQLRAVLLALRDSLATGQEPACPPPASAESC